jgi:hypothetical protein
MKLIMNGDIDSAFKRLEEWYPQVLKVYCTVIFHTFLLWLLNFFRAATKIIYVHWSMKYWGNMVCSLAPYFQFSIISILEKVSTLKKKYFLSQDEISVICFLLHSQRFIEYIRVII